MPYLQHLGLDGGKKGMDIIPVEQAPIPEAKSSVLYIPPHYLPVMNSMWQGDMDINFVEFPFQRHLTQCIKENVYAVWVDWGIPNKY